MTNTWQTQVWKDAAAKFVEGKYCEWHGPTKTTNLVPHHPTRKNGRRIYYTHDQYMSLDGCIVLCGTCNFQEDLGRRLCPECKENYFKPKKGQDKVCWNCFIKTPCGQTVKAYWDAHPEKKRKWRTGKRGRRQDN